MQNVNVQIVAIHRNRGLQQKVLHRARQIRLGIEREQARGRRIDRRDLAAIPQRCARAGEIRKRIEQRDAQAAKISHAFRVGRHRGIVIERARLNVVLVVDEEIRFIAAVINMRNFQGPAQVSAEPLVIVTGFRNVISGNRVRLRVKRGTIEAVVKTKPDSIHGLPTQPSTTASTVSSTPAFASRTTKTAWPSRSCRAASLSEELPGRATPPAAPAALIARRARHDPAKSISTRASAGETLAHRALQQK